MTGPKVEIKCGTPSGTEIWIDGQRLYGTRDITVHQPLDGIAELFIEMISTDVTITMDNVQIELDIDTLREAIAASRKRNEERKASANSPVDVTPHGVRFREFL